jgi:hypothetical protein
MSTKLERETIATKFLDDMHAEGVVIKHEYFWDLFGMVKPHGHNMTIEAAGKINMQFMSRMKELVDTLLKVHKKDLQSVFSKGYRLVPHQERIRTTVRDMSKTLNKELNSHIARLTHIEGAENLSYTDQRHRDYAMQMAAGMKRELRAMPRYPK